MTPRQAVGGHLLAPGRRHPDGSYVDVYRRLAVCPRLTMPRVVLQGPRWWRFCRDSQGDRDYWRHNVYDFTEDVRELVLERLRFDVYAQWADPREWL